MVIPLQLLQGFLPLLNLLHVYYKYCLSLWVLSSLTLCIVVYCLFSLNYYYTDISLWTEHWWVKKFWQISRLQQVFLHLLYVFRFPSSCSFPSFRSLTWLLKINNITNIFKCRQITCPFKTQNSSLSRPFSAPTPQKSLCLPLLSVWILANPHSPHL